MWVSKALERALTTRNITAGFRTTGIYSLNWEAVNAHMGLARQFTSLHSTVQHYYVGTATADVAESNFDKSSLHQFVHSTVIAEDPELPPITPAIAALLALPEITVAPSHKLDGSQDALVDYLQLLLLTSEEYITAMEEKTCCREEARVQSQLW